MSNEYFLNDYLDGVKTEKEFLKPVFFFLEAD
jgi:hypothetical protein